jgi:hypothetical protein
MRNILSPHREAEMVTVPKGDLYIAPSNVPRIRKLDEHSFISRRLLTNVSPFLGGWHRRRTLGAALGSFLQQLEGEVPGYT